MSASENQKSPSVSTGAEGEDDFRFDVIISLPMSIDKAILHQRAVEGLGVPVDAVDRLMAVLDAPAGRLRVSFDIDAESPELARATRAVPACLEMASAIGDANEAIDAATRIVRS